MAKKNSSPNAPQPQDTPSRGPIIVLAAGSIAVAALVGWALTRTVEPAPPAVAASPAAPVAAPQTATGTLPVPPAATPQPAVTPPAATPAATATRDEDGVPRVPPDQLKTLVDRGSVTVIDVRDSIAYTNGHIPGSINIPFARVQAEASRLPKGKPIVAYCT